MTKLAANEIRSTVSVSTVYKIRRTIYMYTSTPVSLPLLDRKILAISVKIRV